MNATARPPGGGGGMNDAVTPELDPAAELATLVAALREHAEIHRAGGTWGFPAASAELIRKEGMSLARSPMNARAI